MRIEAYDSGGFHDEMFDAAGAVRPEASMLLETLQSPTPPDLPQGGTPAQRLDLAFRKVLTVSKADLVKEEAKQKREREKKREEKKPH